jgi:cardiolipin synthase
MVGAASPADRAGPAADPAEGPADTLLHRGAVPAREGARRLAALPGAALTRLRLPGVGRRDHPAAAQPLRRHARVVMRALRHRLIAGNQVDLLIDGPATYAAMFEAIGAARDHINLESYIVEADGPGAELAERLLAKCREGVKVNLLFDGFGSITTNPAYFEALRAGGVQVCEYNPLRSWRNVLSRAVHLRDHRKLLVVDGRVAFLGGINISGVYSSGSSAQHAPKRREAAPSTPPWRDTHVRIAGPLVAELQKLFVAHWNRHAECAIQPAHYLPPLVPEGHHRAAVASCEAGRRRNPIYRALLKAIDAAQERVYLTTAYFVPTRRLLHTLAAAARRGVDVRIVLPSQSDAWAPLHAGRSHYGRLLQAGVRVYERQGALLHAKTTVIDGVWATVGSANLDWRSFVHNAEANAIVLDADFGAEMEAVFLRDVAASREVTLQEWRQRGWLRRMQEALARRFEFLL